jgi:hypothetical protein
MLIWEVNDYEDLFTMTASYNHQQLNNEQMQILLSAYLDNEVTPKERELIEQQLVTSPEVHADLESLRQTIFLLGKLPQLSAPHPFTLSESDVGTRSARANIFGLPGWLIGFGAAMASLLIVMALLLGSMESSTTSQEVALAPKVQEEPVAKSEVITKNETIIENEDGAETKDIVEVEAEEINGLTNEPDDSTDGAQPLEPLTFAESDNAPTQRTGTAELNTPVSIAPTSTLRPVITPQPDDRSYGKSRLIIVGIVSIIMLGIFVWLRLRVK